LTAKAVITEFPVSL